MDDKIIFEKDSASIKNPKHLKRNVFIIFSPRTVMIEPVTCRKIDSEVVAFLPQKSKGFLTSTFRGDFLVVELENLTFQYVLSKKKASKKKKTKKTTKKGKQTCIPKTKKASWRFA